MTQPSKAATVFVAPRVSRRALLMEQGPCVDGHEITDKGYVNQAAVLKNRSILVDRLYARDGDQDVIGL